MIMDMGMDTKMNIEEWYMDFRVLNIIDTVKNGKLREIIRNGFALAKEECEQLYKEETGSTDGSDAYLWMTGEDESDFWQYYLDNQVYDVIINETANKSDIFRTLFKLEFGLEWKTKLLDEVGDIDEWMNQ